MRDLAEVVGLLRQRQNADSGLVEAMRKVRSIYNNDSMEVIFPDLNEKFDPAVPNIIALGLDQYSQRIASVLPNIDTPALKPDQKTSNDNARIRRLAYYSWWQQWRYGIKARKKARFMLAYGVAPSIVYPSAKGVGMAVRDPLMTFPAPTSDPDELTPPDTIYTYFKSWGWLLANYPDQAAILRRDQDTNANDMFEICEMTDSEQHLLGVISRYHLQNYPGTDWSKPGEFSYKGTKITGRRTQAVIGSDYEVILKQEENKSGICWSVTPARIGLDKRMGQFFHSVHLYELEARLAALNLIGIEKGIFPDMVIYGDGNSQPQLITGGGNWQDGRTGNINIVQDGKVDIIKTDPGFLTNPTMDRLREASMWNAQVPSEFAGRSSSNIRTGRRGDSVLSAVVDFPTQEAQEVLAESAQEEIVRGIKIMRAYSGSAPRSFYVNFSKAKGQVDYIPNKHFETEAFSVSFAMPGTDANDLPVGGGQRLGLKTLSRHDFMQLDTYVKDVEATEKRIMLEAIDDALLSRIQTEAANPQSPLTWPDLAELKRLVAKGVAPEDAMDQVNQKAQERQAQITAEGEPDVVPPGSPGAQPGLSLAGVGAEIPTIDAPPEGIQNLAQSVRAFNQQIRA